MKVLKKLFLTVLVVTFALGSFFPVSKAEAAVNTGSLTLNCVINGKALSGVSGRIYRVADYSNGKFVLTSAFQPSAAAVGNLSDAVTDVWRNRALSLSWFADANKSYISAAASVVTDSNGKYTAGGLSKGLYLVVYDNFQVKTDKETSDYAFTPYLLSIPQKVDGKLVYNVVSDAKGSVVTKPVTKETSISVLKHWADSYDVASRPSSIKVTLYRDGVEYNTVKITAAENWRYSWPKLDASHNWYILEDDVDSAYQAVYTPDGGVITLTNSLMDVPPDTPPVGPKKIKPKPKIEVPTPVTPNGPTSTPSSPDITVPHDNTPSGPIPQTGLLWWPVPLLAFGGLALLIIGMTVREKEKE